jgi:hypothetical protein
MSCPSRRKTPDVGATRTDDAVAAAALEFERQADKLVALGARVAKHDVVQGKRAPLQNGRFVLFGGCAFEPIEFAEQPYQSVVVRNGLDHLVDRSGQAGGRGQNARNDDDHERQLGDERFRRHARMEQRQRNDNQPDLPEQQSQHRHGFVRERHLQAREIEIPERADVAQDERAFDGGNLYRLVHLEGFEGEPVRLDDAVAEHRSLARHRRVHRGEDGHAQACDRRDGQQRLRRRVGQHDAEPQQQNGEAVEQFEPARIDRLPDRRGIGRDALRQGRDILAFEPTVGCPQGSVHHGPHERIGDAQGEKFDREIRREPKGRRQEEGRDHDGTEPRDARLVRGDSDLPQEGSDPRKRVERFGIHQQRDERHRRGKSGQFEHACAHRQDRDDDRRKFLAQRQQTPGAGQCMKDRCHAALLHAPTACGKAGFSTPTKWLVCRLFLLFVCVRNSWK